MDDSSSASYLVIPPPPMLTETDIDDLIADLDLGGRHVNRVLNVADDFGGGLFRGGMVFLRGGPRSSVGTKYGDYINCAGDDDEEENQGGDANNYDLDDELVPVSVSKKLKRGRLRKSGKRSRRSVTSRGVHSHVKSGCVYGKHGFGFRFRCGYSGNSFI